MSDHQKTISVPRGGNLIDKQGRSKRGATRLRKDLCTGHGCFPPRENDEASDNMFVNGIAWHRQSDSWKPHCCGVCHTSFLASGSPSFFVNGLEASRIHDPVDCGSIVMEGSFNMFIGPTPGL